MGQTVFSDKEHPYELDVKNAILANPQLFGNIGISKVISEKSIHEFSVIADLLIFSSIKGAIGIEIKTEHDSTHRLNKQLRAYESLCTEVWVVVHDKLYEDTLKVLKANNHPSVGVITYSAYEGKIVFGIIKEAIISDNFSAYHLLNVLWKTELLIMANRINVMAVDSNTQDIVTIKNAGQPHPDGKDKVLTKRATKRQLIIYIIDRLGKLGAYQMVVDMFVNEIKDPAKVLKYYSFKEIKTQDTEVYNVKAKRKKN